MNRIKRYHEENIAYFITAITQDRAEIFTDPLACEMLINIATYYKFSCDFNVYGFVVMPDHFHMIIQPYGDVMLSEIVKRIKAGFSRYYNKINKTQGSVWQKSFYDRGIRNKTMLEEILVYMHNNPHRKGLVDDISKYSYSSFNYYNHGDKRYQLLLHTIE